MLSTVSDVQHISVLHDVLLALQAQRATRTGLSFRSSLEQLVPVNRLRADEVLGEVRMYGPGSVYRLRTAFNSPSPAFVFAYSEKRNQAEQFVRFAHKPNQSTLM